MAGLAQPVQHGDYLIERLTARDPELEVRLRQGLRDAEDRLREVVAEAKEPYVADVVGHLVVGGGGKLLRPLLVLLGAEFGERRHTGRVVGAAVVAELVHTASLCHDDVMDLALTRRGIPSVNARFGNRTAVFAGNWLLARAAGLAADLGPDGVRLHAEVAERLVQGQMYELTGPAEGVDPLAHYYAVISGKSAALISTSLGLGAAQAGAVDADAAALAEFGEQLGLAFQISDDLLDVTSAASVSGKEQGKDLAAGVTSLPVLLARADRRPQTRELRELLAPGAADSRRRRRRALAALRASDAMAESRALMHRHLDRARDALGRLPDRPVVAVLDTLCDFVAGRDR